jgi:hypothetical protein
MANALAASTSQIILSTALVRTLREVYGQSFTAGKTDKLRAVLLQRSETSLSRLRRDHETGHLDRKIVPVARPASHSWQPLTLGTEDLIVRFSPIRVRGFLCYYLEQRAQSSSQPPKRAMGERGTERDGRC